MFGLSFTEVMIIALLALLLLGPEQLPTAARTAGKWMRELRRATDDLKDQIESEMNVDEKWPRPNLVPPVPVGKPPPATAPPATAENVPGLDAALAEPSAEAAPPASEEAPSASRQP